MKLAYTLWESNIDEWKLTFVSCTSCIPHRGFSIVMSYYERVTTSDRVYICLCYILLLPMSMEGERRMTAGACVDNTNTVRITPITLFCYGVYGSIFYSVVLHTDLYGTKWGVQLETNQNQQHLAVGACGTKTRKGRDTNRPVCRRLLAKVAITSFLSVLGNFLEENWGK